MRTTLTIDDGIMRELKKAAHERGTTMKGIVNEALRAGLEALREPESSAEYRCPTFSVGDPAHVNLDRARHLAAELEDEETIRKLALRK